MHGGAAPQVKRAAEERIRDLVDPALNRLAKLIEDLSGTVALAAVKDVLDRAGYGVRQRIDIEVRIRTMAVQMGLDPDEAVAEAQRLLESSNAGTR